MKIRFIMVTPLAAGFQSLMDSNFAKPDDSKHNSTNRKIMVSIHMYASYDFPLNADNTSTKFLDSYKYRLTTNFRAIYGKFVAKNVQVILGELATLNKNNTKDRIEYDRFYVQNTRKNHLSCVLWDYRVVGDDMGEFIRGELI